MFHKVITGSLNKKVGGNIQVFPYSIFCIKSIISCVACVCEVYFRSLEVLILFLMLVFT